jgi:ubiquinone/menaquinone biosynthesis C-methylase UbiE
LSVFKTSKAGITIKKHLREMLMTIEARNRIISRYKYLAPLYDFLEAPMEWLGLGNLRHQLLREVVGPEVLEVGFGTGKNLPHYNAGVNITAIDLSAEMLKRSESRHSNNRVSRHIMDVENLRYGAERYDQVVASFVFCTVSDPVKGLEEVARVVKPRGHIYLLEHVRPANKFLATVFDWLNPLAVWMFGVNINRETRKNIDAAGLKVIKDTPALQGIVHIYECVRAK